MLTGEIIHNPGVNQRLRDAGAPLPGRPRGARRSAALRPDDVVLLPAFGVTAPRLRARCAQSGAVVVDTTCGSVLNVWKNVERYARDGFTSLVHGKCEPRGDARHGEPRAAHAGRALPGGLRPGTRPASWPTTSAHGGDRDGASSRRFAGASRRASTPTCDLERIGVANQTTMLSSESLAIARLIGEAMAERYGPAEGRARFRSFDTICSATQERQDALARPDRRAARRAAGHRRATTRPTRGTWSRWRRAACRPTTSRARPALRERATRSATSRSAARPRPRRAGWLPAGAR